MRNIDLLRRDALAQRLKTVGGRRIHWEPEHRKFLSDWIMSAPDSAFRDAEDKRKRRAAGGDISELRIKLLAAGSISAVKDLGGSNSFTFRISSDDVDLEDDRVKPAGMQLNVFSKNPAVLDSHNMQAAPVGTSSLPWTVGNSILANVDFPQPGISAQSDQVRGLVAGGHLRGASVGFIPIKFDPSKDPDRPFGLDFHEWILLEWSICSIPANSACLLIGASATRSAPRSARSDAGRAQKNTGSCGRSWDSKCGLLNPRDCKMHRTTQTQSRAERMEEAARITRAVLGGR
jgi:hypothetical protein